jgi:hypothetical protein
VCSRPFSSQMCKYLHCLKNQKYKIWCPAVVFLKESTDAKLIHISETTTLYMPGVLSPKPSFTGRRKLGIILWRGATDLILCLDSSLLMCLKVVLMKGRKATHRFLQGQCGSCQWTESPSDKSCTDNPQTG